MGKCLLFMPIMCLNDFLKKLYRCHGVQHMFGYGNPKIFNIKVLVVEKRWVSYICLNLVYFICFFIILEVEVLASVGLDGEGATHAPTSWISNLRK